MPGSAASASPAAATAAQAAASSFGDNKGIKFEIKTGNNRWACTLQERSAYERTKTARANSTDSVESSASSTVSH
ncbi:uncharacterized protein MAM_07960 [Metarhizium album ARSEF 1941]|uniref:Uncharacterized protein n=1 Tax=Metarhizium album (strain ARSEF 1941) TaxID=1081103 RepID=A0A0B2WJW3_METAS|nr:uncharacterized protein MAM_07960 [Metarhizium album ARSEF 1941]KHN94223.1 hypothetical protein MAM_07960 [Metarhizium album ARSEF 1941]